MSSIRDEIYRLSKLYDIKNKSGKTVGFSLNRVQQHYHQHRHTRNIILKSRQLGFSTYKCIHALDKTLFTKNHNALMIAHTGEAAKSLFSEKIQYAYDRLPEAFRGLYYTETDRVNQLKFGFQGKSSKDFSTLSVATSARSGTYQYVHITELAYLDKNHPIRAEEVLSGAIPAVPPDGQLDIESTARGNSGLFYEYFMSAYKKEPRSPKEFKGHFYNWQWDEYELSHISDEHIKSAIGELPYTLREYQQMHHLTDREITFYYFTWLSFREDYDMMRQEYPTTVEEAFMASQNVLFDYASLQEQVIKEPVQGQSGWRIYDTYSINHRYAMGVDVAEGIGRDSSTAVIWDFTENKVVAIYASDSVAPDVLAYEIADMGYKYGTCLIAVERNNHGHATLSKLREVYNPYKIYREKKKEKMIIGSPERFGWATTSASKPKMLYDIARSIADKSVIIPDKWLIQEMLHYSKDDVQDTKNMNTKHYDTLMACAIGWQMRYEIGDMMSSTDMDDMIYG